MKRDCRAKSGMALGGIGTGGIELRKDGMFYNWHIFNNKPFGTGAFMDPREWKDDSMLFFMVRFEEEGEEPRMKLLQIDSGADAAAIPCQIYTFPWVSSVDQVEYEASFPFTNLKFSDDDMPFTVELEAYSPFIPHDVKNSSIPGAVFNFLIRPLSDKPVDVMLMACFRNAAGYDVKDKRFAAKVIKDDNSVMVEVSADLVDKKHSSWGTQALMSLSGDSGYYLGWQHRHPYYEKVIISKTLNDIDDTEGRNYRKADGFDKPLAQGAAFNTVSRSTVLRDNEPFRHTFIYTWNFPNLYSGMTPKEERKGAKKEQRLEGYYYTNSFKKASDTALYLRDELPVLTERTRQFHNEFFNSSLEDYVLDQVNSQLNTFVTSAWLTRAMDFGVQEGLTSESHFGPLATIDVAMYGSLSTAALFPELDKAMMRAHKRLQGKSGEICHGIGRNFTAHDTDEGVTGRLDLPSQYVILALRGYFWTGDAEYLKEMWPSVRKALDYVLRERDPNGDLLPDMAGAMCTYDNFPMYGAAAYVASLWLAAVRYALEAAQDMDDRKFIEKYSEVLETGKKVFEDKLYNGEYYRLYNDEGGERGDMDEGILTDQIIGQWAMHFTGFENLFEKERVDKALHYIMKTAFHPDYGLRNCRWPGDTFLHPVDENCWSDQANTCWSGVELAFSSFLIYEGMVDRGLRIIRNVDDRYRKAGLYFDHQEFGGHYFRPMSAWANINAMLGLNICKGSYRFGPRITDDSLRLFFSFGSGTAHYERKLSDQTESHTVNVLSGIFTVKELILDLARSRKQEVSIKVAGSGHGSDAYDVTWSERQIVITFKTPVDVEVGSSVDIIIG